MSYLISRDWPVDGEDAPPTTERWCHFLEETASGAARG